MKNTSNEDSSSIHFVGIGGIGMSALARILQKQGKNVTGSDLVPSAITRGLKLAGIKVAHEHKSANISKKHDLVIYSPAIPSNNPELQQAKKFKIKTLSYPQALGALTQDHFTIAIAGSHGKSTTTAMIALLLTKAGLDPTVVIGTKIREFGNHNFRLGKGKYLVIEACEYKRSFLNFHPDILVITNIDADHLDYYKTAKNYQKAFQELAQKVPKNGFIVTSKNKKTFKNIRAKLLPPKSNFNFHIQIPGKFNLQNAACAAAVGAILKIPENTVESSLNSYRGSWRRMEYKHKKLGKTIFIDDYGHHPTEIHMTLEAIRERHPGKKILCIFQPHQYSRTYLLLKDFGRSFKKADAVIIPEIYKVRDSENFIRKISTEDLVKEIRKHHTHVKNGHGIKNTAEYIQKNHQKFDIIVTMGAGDIDRIYRYI